MTISCYNIATESPIQSLIQCPYPLSSSAVTESIAFTIFSVLMNKLVFYTWQDTNCVWVRPKVPIIALLLLWSTDIPLDYLGDLVGYKCGCLENTQVTVRVNSGNIYTFVLQWRISEVLENSWWSIPNFLRYIKSLGYWRLVAADATETLINLYFLGMFLRFLDI
jgi:hypothetical protein